jgi:hypothetical protein
MKPANRKRLTPEQHRAMAVDLVAIEETTLKMFLQIQLAYGKSREVAKRAIRILLPQK